MIGICDQGAFWVIGIFALASDSSCSDCATCWRARRRGQSSFVGSSGWASSFSAPGVWEQQGPDLALTTAGTEASGERATETPR
jgi:hypothetical protein